MGLISQDQLLTESAKRKKKRKWRIERWTRSEFSIFELSLHVVLAGGAVVGHHPIVVVRDGVFHCLSVAALVIAGQVTARFQFTGTHRSVRHPFGRLLERQQHQ